MPYCTLDDLITAFGETELIQITDKGNPRTGGVVEAVAQLEIDWACNTIDGYVRKRYGALLQNRTPPARLVGIGCDLARYRLHDERATEAVRERFNDAIKFLRDIAAGRADLDIDEVGEERRVAIKAAPRTFTRETLADYR